MKLDWTLARVALAAVLVGPLVATQCAEQRGASVEKVERKDVPRVSDPLATNDARRAMLWSERLRDISVSGQSTGLAGVPGEFFLLQNTILEAAAPGAVDRLLDSDVPQARAMALAIYARDLAIGRGRLSDHVCDDGEFRYNPGGCIVSRSSVGEFARELLEYPSILGVCETCTIPLLGPDELRRLDWLALSSEGCANLYDLAARKILGSPDDGIAASPSWESLHDDLAGVEAWRRVKALARLMARAGRNVDQRRFRDVLVATAASLSAPLSVRLAAASALTRAGVEETVDTLERLQPELDALEPGEPGQAILQALRGRLTFDAETHGLRKSKTWMETQALAPKIISTFKRFGSEPFALDLILETGFNSFGAHTDEVRAVVERALEAQLERARYPFADWDIESDLAYRLRRGAVAARDDADLSALLARAGSSAQLPN